MRSIEFNEVNAKIAEDSKDYQTINAYHDEVESTMVACMQFTAEELAIITKTGKLWYKQYIYGTNGALQPFNISVKKEDVIPIPDRENSQ